MKKNQGNLKRKCVQILIYDREKGNVGCEIKKKIIEEKRKNIKNVWKENGKKSDKNRVNNLNFRKAKNKIMKARCKKWGKIATEKRKGKKGKGMQAILEKDCKKKIKKKRCIGIRRKCNGCLLRTENWIARNSTFNSKIIRWYFS